MKTTRLLPAAAVVVLLLMMILAAMPELTWYDESHLQEGLSQDPGFEPKGAGSLPGETGQTLSLTSYNVTPSIGTHETEFTFHVEYFDQDNDPPASGYPRVHIYSDDQGMMTYKDGWYSMTESDPADTNHTNGKMYQLTFVL